MNPGLFPVDIVQTETGNIARSKSHARKQQQNGTISTANWCGTIAGFNDPLDISRLHIPW
jgi:hypothetical protein